MKKNFIIIFVALLFVVNIFIGCGPNIDPNVADNENLYIHVLTRGYGTEWVHALGKKFAEENNVNVEVKETTESSVLTSSMDKGPTKNNFDIYIDLTNIRYKLSAYTNKINGYPQAIKDLTYLYEKEIPGEGIKLKDKMNPSFLAQLNCGTEQTPKYYSLPWACGVMGLCYNVDVFQELFGEKYIEKLPTTSEELRELAEEIKNKGKIAFAYPGQIDYFSSSLFYDWWAQYEGIDGFYNFYKGLCYDEIQDKYIISKDIYAQQGRLKALEGMQSLIAKDTGYVFENVNDYGNNNFRSLQTRFLTASEGIAMYPCGDWLEQESAKGQNYNFAFMKTPVLSSLIDKLDTVKTESDLRKVVAAIDNDDLSKLDSSFSTNDIERIKQARNITSTLGFSHSIYVPAYTNAEELVNKFLLFFASDEGIEIYKNNVLGGFLPFNFNYDDVELSNFEKSVLNIIENANYVGELSTSPLFYKGMLSGHLMAEGSIESMLGASKDSKYYKSANEVFSMMQYSDAEWADVMRRAGL